MYLLPPHRRGRPALFPWHFIPEYLPWYSSISHPFVQNLIHRSRFDRGVQDMLNLYEAVSF